MNVWNKVDRPLILASNSPRRKEIFARMGFVFTTCAPRVDNEESFFAKGTLEESLRALALAKACSVGRDKTDHLVFGGDTVVCDGSRLMGKPKSRDDAREILGYLSGKTHQVYSGIALSCRECAFVQTGVACTDVRFRQLCTEEIEAYLDTGEYADKAGAYGIQGAALSFIDTIDGCYYNVVGLPVAETVRLFQAYQYRKDHAHA